MNTSLLIITLVASILVATISLVLAILAIRSASNNRMLIDFLLDQLSDDKFQSLMSDENDHEEDNKSNA